MVKSFWAMVSSIVALNGLIGSACCVERAITNFTQLYDYRVCALQVLLQLLQICDCADHSTIKTTQTGERGRLPHAQSPFLTSWHARMIHKLLNCALWLSRSTFVANCLASKAGNAACIHNCSLQLFGYTFPFL